MSAEEALKAMGFEYERRTEIYNIDGVPTIKTGHIITHPHVDGLFLFDWELEKVLKRVVWAVKTISVMNEKHNDLPNA